MIFLSTIFDGIENGIFFNNNFSIIGGKSLYLSLQGTKPENNQDTIHQNAHTSTFAVIVDIICLSSLISEASKHSGAK